MGKAHTVLLFFRGGLRFRAFYGEAKRTAQRSRHALMEFNGPHRAFSDAGKVGLSV